MKKWYQSKTFWINIVGAIGIAVQTQTGYIMNPATQGVILSVINMILRKITKEPVTWK